MSDLAGTFVNIYRYGGHKRTWRSLWRKRAVRQVLFVGRVTGGQMTRGMNQPASASIQARDIMADLTERMT